MSLHQNFMSVPWKKAEHMESWRNGTFDEAAYREDVARDDDGLADW